MKKSSVFVRRVTLILAVLCFIAWLDGSVSGSSPAQTVTGSASTALLEPLDPGTEKDGIEILAGGYADHIRQRVYQALVFFSKSTDFIFWAIEVTGDNQDHKIIHSQFNALRIFLLEQKSMIDYGKAITGQANRYADLEAIIEKFGESTGLFCDFYEGKMESGQGAALEKASAIHNETKETLFSSAPPLPIKK